MGDGVELPVSTGRLRQQRLDRGLTSPTRTAVSSRSLGVGLSRLGEKYVLGADRSPRSARLCVSHSPARTVALPGRRRPSESPDGVPQGLVLCHGLALLADAGGVGLPACPLED